jgi:hypothetical protein
MHRSLRRRARLALPSAYSRCGMAEQPPLPPPQLLRKIKKRDSSQPGNVRPETVASPEPQVQRAATTAAPTTRRRRSESGSTMHFSHSIRIAQHHRRQSQRSTEFKSLPAFASLLVKSTTSADWCACCAPMTTIFVIASQMLSCKSFSMSYSRALEMTGRPAAELTPSRTSPRSQLGA